MIWVQESAERRQDYDAPASDDRVAVHLLPSLELHYIVERPSLNLINHTWYLPLPQRRMQDVVWAPDSSPSMPFSGYGSGT